MTEKQKYIASLERKLAIEEAKLQDLMDIPSFVRKRKGMEGDFKKQELMVKIMRSELNLAKNPQTNIPKKTEPIGVVEDYTPENLGKRTGNTFNKPLIIGGIVVVALAIGFTAFKLIKK